MLSDSCFCVCLCVSLCACLSCNVGVLWQNGWMDQDATWYGGRPRPRRHCVIDGDPAPSKTVTAPATFRPMSIVAKRLGGSRCHLVLR